MCTDPAAADNNNAVRSGLRCAPGQGEAMKARAHQDGAVRAAAIAGAYDAKLQAMIGEQVRRRNAAGRGDNSCGDNSGDNVLMALFAAQAGNLTAENVAKVNATLALERDAAAAEVEALKAVRSAH